MLALDPLIDASPAPLSSLLDAPPPGSSPQLVKDPQSRSAHKPRFIRDKHTTVALVRANGFQAIMTVDVGNVSVRCRRAGGHVAH
ncbi:MAG TPA: hypothetical protein VG755_45605 [Nannocystaceae bacterium]|nr:hypothetical protein [Nannocystaceae bacterium]